MAGKINLTDELKKYFGFNKFKGNQEAIIQNLLSDANHIVNMVDAGKTAESRMMIDEALRNYYWALVLYFCIRSLKPTSVLPRIA